jgi:hypothetical protein
MPRRCTICASPSRQDIEIALARGRSLRSLAGKHRLSKSAIHRHKRHADSAQDWLIKALSKATAGERKTVRGNPDKTKPHRWEPGQSGNRLGRPTKPVNGWLDGLLTMR